MSIERGTVYRVPSRVFSQAGELLASIQRAKQNHRQDIANMTTTVSTSDLARLVGDAEALVASIAELPNQPDDLIIQDEVGEIAPEAWADLLR